MIKSRSFPVFRRNHTALANAISHRRKCPVDSHEYENLTKVIEILVSHIRKLLAKENDDAEKNLGGSNHETELITSLKEGMTLSTIPSIGNDFKNTCFALS